MMFNANKTTQHLQITKKFNKLVPKVKFYGIDIQIVKYLEMYNILDPKLKKIIDKALFLSCEPLGDKSSLRNLRGIQVKSIKDN